MEKRAIAFFPHVQAKAKKVISLESPDFYTFIFTLLQAH